MATYVISKHLSDLLGLRIRVIFQWYWHFITPRLFDINNGRVELTLKPSCYIGDKAGKFIAQGHSAGKMCWFLFYVAATLQKQHCDIFRMLIHTLNILMCCNSPCLSCQSYQLLYLLPSPNAATEMVKQHFNVWDSERRMQLLHLLRK